MSDKDKKKISTQISYAYLCKVKKWMNCPNCLEGKMHINKESTLWTCDKCGYQLSADEFEDDYVFWFCDECGAYLNNQEGFDPKAPKNICQNCGYENDTTSDNIKGMCSDCGKILDDPEATLCDECREKRIEKARKWLKRGAIVLGAIGTAHEVTKQILNSSDNGYVSLPDSDEDGYDDEIENETEMRCANCGNTDERYLTDEGDTIYCSKCFHRTSKESGEDDLVECPYCHRMRDRKALYCRWCNDSTWRESTPEEFEEIDKILKDMGY